MTEWIPNSLLGIEMPNFDAVYHEAAAREIMSATGIAQDPARVAASYLVDQARIESHHERLLSRLSILNNPPGNSLESKVCGLQEVGHVCLRVRETHVLVLLVGDISSIVIQMAAATVMGPGHTTMVTREIVDGCLAAFKKRNSRP